MVTVLTVFLLGFAAWGTGLVVALALCAAAARGDRRADQPPEPR